MEFIKENMTLLLPIIPLALGIFYYVSKVTKTDKDDKVFSLLNKFFSFFKLEHKEEKKDGDA